MPPNSITQGTTTELQDLTVELVERRKLVQRAKIPTVESSAQHDLKVTDKPVQATVSVSSAQTMTNMNKDQITQLINSETQLKKDIQHEVE